MYGRERARKRVCARVYDREKVCLIKCAREKVRVQVCTRICEREKVKAHVCAPARADHTRAGRKNEVVGRNVMGCAAMNNFIISYTYTY